MKDEGKGAARMPMNIRGMVFGVRRVDVNQKRAAAELPVGWLADQRVTSGLRF